MNSQAGLISLRPCNNTRASDLDALRNIGLKLLGMSDTHNSHVDIAIFAGLQRAVVTDGVLTLQTTFCNRLHAQQAH